MPNDLKAEEQIVRVFVEKYCKISGYKLNPDADVANTVIEGLARNRVKYGKQYCPCRFVEGDIEKDRPKICPCKWHKDEIAKDGFCHCRLFSNK